MSILHIFDFDDTLVDSAAQVHITHTDGRQESLSSEEYAKYTPKDGDIFNFSDFDAYPEDAEIIEPVFKELRQAISKSGLKNVTILTARSNSAPVKLFMKNQGIEAINIAAVGTSDPYAKAQYIVDRVKKESHDMVVVFEDNVRNIRTIRKSLTKNGIILTTNRVNNGRIVDIRTESMSLREIL